jgi:STAS domain
LGQKAALMPGVKLTTSACNGHIFVALSGGTGPYRCGGRRGGDQALVARGRYLVIDMTALDFLDCGALGALLRVRAPARLGGGDLVLVAPQPRVPRLLALTGNDEVFWVPASVEAAVAGYRRPPKAVLLAAACGAHCTPWEGSAIAYWYRVIAAGAAAAPEGSVRGRAQG